MNLTLTLKTNQLFLYRPIKLLLTLKSNIMRKIKLLLSVMLSAMAWTGTMAQTVVTDVSQLSNSKVYTIECPRGTFVLNNDQNAIVSSHKSNGTVVNDAAATDDPSTKFCIIQSDGLYYIYSPKLKKFAGVTGQILSFNANRHVGFEITNDGTDGLEGSVFRLKAPKFNFYANNNNSGNIVVNSYSTPEGGNTMTIKEAGASTVDEQELLASLRTEYLDDHKVYKINNVRVNTWTADANGTALTGTKAYPGASEAYQQFAFITRDGKEYMYNLGAKKFVGLDDDKVILTADKTKFTPVEYIELNNDTYGYMFMLPEKNWYFNGQGGGGFAINSWANEDDGNRNQLVEVNQVNVYEEMLDFFEAPYWDVTYNVYMNGEKIHSTVVNSKRNVAAELPAADQRPYLTYTYDTSVIETGVTEVNVIATWTGPFEISTDFANANWYDMAMRNTWYVTSAAKDANDGDAYITQNANTMGLVEDSYQWAFIGNPYAGFQIINKAEGEGKSFGWTDAQAINAGIPTIMDDAEGNHAWNIVPSTNTTVPAGSFCLNVPGTNLYINQFGGAGGKVKFWNSANNLGDGGSAFTVFDVPTNFAEYVTSEIAPSIETTGYFALTDAAKTAIGYDPAYETECPFETYKSIKEKLAAAMSDINNFVLPETGYYNLKNKNYGTYLGIDPSDANMYGNYKVCNLPKQIVKLTKNNDNTYTIGLMGKFAPATVAQSKGVTATADAANYTVVITKPGYAVFQANTEEKYSCLHCASGGAIVGWEAAADASMWEVLEPGYIEYTVGEAGYATAYFPFAVTIPETEKVAVPEAKGVWTFDDGTTGSLTATDGVTVADGVATVPVGDNLAMSTTGLTDLNTYTFMMDIKVPADKASDNSLSAYTSLFRGADNSGDGGLFIFYKAKENSRKIGIAAGNMGYGSSIELDKWYRVVFSCENAIPTVYVDGVKAVAATVASTNHWTLGEVVRFFADNIGESEENEVQTTEIRFWDVALNATEAKMLGSVGTTPIVETKTVSAYTGSIMGNWIQTTEVAGGIIPEATPVILKGDPFTYKFKVGVFEEEDPENALKIYDKTVDGGKALAKRQVIPEPVLNNDLKGTFEPISAEGKYVLAKPEGKDVCFYQAISGNIEPCKAYLELNSEVKAFYINFDGNATAIENVNANVNNNNDAIYNLAGQKLSKLQKGINIVNGKKILK
jgi:hypothetical protein